MAKHSDLDDWDLPPPYSPGPGAGPLRSQGHRIPLSPTSHLQSQVASVPGRIRHRLRACYTQQFEDDVRLIDLLAPVIEEFLVDVGVESSTPPCSFLILVPSEAVPSDAMLSDLEDMRQRGEPCRVVRVPTAPGDGKASLDTKAPAPRPHITPPNPSRDSNFEFTDWGRWDSVESSDSKDLAWWQDEGMAHRLVSYLLPEQPRGPADKPMNMNIRAEMVTFRHQNFFKLLESLSGWAIVVTVGPTHSFGR